MSKTYLGFGQWISNVDAGRAYIANLQKESGFVTNCPTPDDVGEDYLPLPEPVCVENVGYYGPPPVADPEILPPPSLHDLLFSEKQQEQKTEPPETKFVINVPDDDILLPPRMFD